MNSDSDDQIDITSALLPSKRAKKSPSKKIRKVATAAPGDEIEEVPKNASVATAFDHDSDAEEDALFASLPELVRAKNLAEGTAVVKGRKDLKGNKTLTGGGSFQSLGLPAPLLKALLQRGFTTPTPIQRMALPSILGSTSTETSLAGKKLIVARDHLCMARTGSGKTLCYLLPLLAQLLFHSNTFGARGLILVPTRELALQVIKVGKDLSRGLKGDGESLRWAMVVGGEGMEDQFSMMAGNPDVYVLPFTAMCADECRIIATPGRLLHLIVEMNLDLRAIQYCVFDEADRLFELGFAEQLHEILFRMPPTRQTLLFSATLPSTLVGFAKAGLQSPKLIRLDVDSKISKELQMAYLSVKGSEKEALLLGVLREVIGVPLMSDRQRALQDEYIEDEADDDERGRSAYKGKGKGKAGVKRKRVGDDEATRPADYVDPSAHQTLVFVSTKHHVEYISALLTQGGYAVSTIYGSMDQTSRRLHLAKFRAGRTSILVVTDLAARGIDIPGVENVINYDFPNGARAFVHRVGRTARAGRTGWAFSFITPAELPHLLDLQLFLGRPLKPCPLAGHDDPNVAVDYSDQLILGIAPRALLDIDYESYKTMMIQFPAIEILGNVSRRGQKMYERGIAKASAESYRRAKELQHKGKGLAISTSLTPVLETESMHPIFNPYLLLAGGDQAREAKRAELMKIVNSFKPAETVFEVGQKGHTPANQLMKERRKALEKSVRARALVVEDEDEEMPLVPDDEEERKARTNAKNPLLDEEADDAQISVRLSRCFDGADELQAVFGATKKRKRAPGESFQDPNFYLNYEQEGADTERGCVSLQFRMQC